MANSRLITIYTLDLKFTKAMQGGRESNKVTKGAIAAEVLRADDADAAARVGESRAKSDGRIKGRAVRVGLEDCGGGLEAVGVAQDSGGNGGKVRGGGRVLERSIPPAENLVNGASDAVRLGVKRGLLLQAVRGSVAVADVIRSVRIGSVAVLAVVALGGPEVGDCVVRDAVGRFGGGVAAG